MTTFPSISMWLFERHRKEENKALQMSAPRRRTPRSRHHPLRDAASQEAVEWEWAQRILRSVER